MQMQVNIGNDYLDGDDVMNIKTNYLKTFGSSLGVATSLCLLHLAEARYVLQNRLPNFQTYPNFFNLVRDSMSVTKPEFFNGVPGYIPIFAILSL